MAKEKWSFFNLELGGKKKRTQSTREEQPRSLGDLLQQSIRSDAVDKPKRTEMSAELTQAYKEVLDSAYAKLLKKIMSWHTVYCVPVKLNYDSISALDAIKRLVDLYSTITVNEPYGVRSNPRQLEQYLIDRLRLSLQSENMNLADIYLDTSLGHLPYPLQIQIDRDHLKAQFHSSVRNGLIIPAVHNVDLANRTRLSEGLRVESQVQPPPKKREQEKRKRR